MNLNSDHWVMMLPAKTNSEMSRYLLFPSMNVRQFFFVLTVNSLSLSQLGSPHTVCWGAAVIGGDDEGQKAAVLQGGSRGS